MGFAPLHSLSQTLSRKDQIILAVNPLARLQSAPVYSVHAQILHRRRQPNSQHRLTHAKVPKNIPHTRNYHQATLVLARQPLRCSSNTVFPEIQRFMAGFMATFHKSG
jgi:hypothetical protein